MCVFVVLSSRILLYRERKRDQNDFADDERFRRVREEREEARLRHLRFFLSSSRDKESSSFLDDDDICVSCDPKREDKECREDVLCDVVLCCVRGPPFRRRPSRRAVALFDDGVLQFRLLRLAVPFGTVLGGEHDGANRDRPSLVVLDRDLALRIGAQPG